MPPVDESDFSDCVPLPWVFNAIHIRLLRGIGLRMPGVAFGDIRIDYIASLGDLQVHFRGILAVFSKEWIEGEFIERLFETADRSGQFVVNRIDAIDVANTMAFIAYTRFAEEGLVPSIGDDRETWNLDMP